MFARHKFPTGCLSPDHRIDPEKKGQLSVELDNISFFKDNEYTGSIMKGYSLPGFWIQTEGCFYPLGNIKLELGVHMFRYWGKEISEPGLSGYCRMERRPVSAWFPCPSFFGRRWLCPIM